MAAPKLDSSLIGDPKALFPIGLRTAHGKFLTVESFGDQLNASGTSLKPKQVFTFESDGKGLYAFKTHKGKYLTADLEVNAKAESKDKNEWFSIEYKDGVVYIQSQGGKFLSASSGGQVTLSSNKGSDEELEIVIDYHPQICLMAQKRYLSVVGDELRSNAPSQFGRETMLVMEAADNDPDKLRGQWCIKGTNGKYLSVDGNGACAANATAKDESTRFVFEFHGLELALKSMPTGKYLSHQASGMKAIRPTVGPKEIIKLFDSDAQITLKAANGKYMASQGPNTLTKAVDDITGDKEILYILEHHEGKWSLRTEAETFMSVKDNGALSADSKTRGPNELFEFSYHNGKLALKGANGKYVTAKNIGGVDVKAAEVGDQEKFEYFFFNREKIVFLTSNRTFVGCTGDRVFTNKVLPETFQFEFKDSKYAVKTSTGKYFKEGGEGKIGLADEPQWFFLEYHHNKLALKTEGGKYLKSETQGWLTATSDSVGEHEIYEF